ncbi:G-type lectin S-receptor-like serine/threonine-protein kinase [Pyrus ussuriensis x Pyrus communis]|uniref:Receptor-like serine/threonine-protein kinase n=1 Tax=Pyrus ussuriensis x Pyrus communis TaxID=2448454 RepID=A0A5N5FQ42_9ROSA|nr:G-type lectin S-receptor-like serine/threonine-protein kinase At1g34300 [Pyrus x bretschneideri]KAB2603460.1 G-type lectin S-receptor-like serine/threonine-protein kinase [Pyrus ussuriensis x Pyrus communis]
MALQTHIRFSLLLLITSLLSAAVSAAITISPGSSLSAATLSTTWLSPSDTFSLGFIPSDPPTSPPSYIAAISYSGGVPVWSAGAGKAVDSGGTLQFLQSGTLRLVNGSGATLWDSNTASRGVSSAEIDDSGNLVLRNGTVTVWSSFDNPTDSIVPEQNFTVSKVLRSGLYSFKLVKNGNLTLLWNDSIVYWNQGLNSSVKANLSSPTLGLQSIGILSITDPKLSTAAIVAYSNDYAEAGDILRFLKLGSDGNLRIYSSSRGSGAITERWAAVTNQCEVFGYCGNMGVCSYNDSNPVCGCMSLNFELVDPKDSRKGCKRKMETEDCPQSLTMLDLVHTQFLTYPPETESQIFFVGISACRSNCLVNSACDASTSLSDGTGLCYYKTPGFLSGYHSPAMSSSSYIKVCGPVVPNPSSSMGTGDKKKDWKLRAWIVVVVVIATLFTLMALEGGLWWWFCRNSPAFGGLSAQYALLEYASGAPVQFSYKELQRSTKGFKEKLGAGGFGAVYKGILANRTVVAVKQLEGIEQGEKQFRMEVATISSTHHLNLVRLIGFCSEGRHRLLVYEFMKNGSLDSFLFATQEQSGKLLNWESRFNVALGTARGITYLHEECRDCIVHCDIKPENILLDENYNAKVSDFGLAKLISAKDHRYRTLTSVRGTRGYLAPEWLANLPITSKSDVYSYGMVLLEIVSGRRNFEVSEETNRKKFSLWAFEEFEKGNIKGIVDKRLVDQDVDMDQVKRAIQVTFWCIQEQPSHRPMMGKVLQMLEGITDIETPPGPRAAIEGSAGGTIMNVSSDISTLSTIAASAPAPSSSSSLQVSGVSPLTSGRNTEKATASLIQSDAN